MSPPFDGRACGDALVRHVEVSLCYRRLGKHDADQIITFFIIFMDAAMFTPTFS
jgi:hypothetical protein